MKKALIVVAATAGAVAGVIAWRRRGQTRDAASTASLWADSVSSAAGNAAGAVSSAATTAAAATSKAAEQLAQTTSDTAHQLAEAAAGAADAAAADAAATGVEPVDAGKPAKKSRSRAKPGQDEVPATDT
jgi:hypothetical protein